MDEKNFTQALVRSVEGSVRAFVATKKQAEVIKAHDQLQRFLAVGNPDVIAAFADSLDQAASDQIEAIAKRIQAAREARGEK